MVNRDELRIIRDHMAARISVAFFQRKVEEYERLRKEIAQSELEVEGIANGKLYED